MRTLKLSMLALLLAGLGFVGCGSGTVTNHDSSFIPPTGTGGTLAIDVAGGMGGNGGSTLDGGPAQPDVPMGADTNPPVIDATLPGEGNLTSPTDICAGLTPEQCHDRIINPPGLLDPSILQQDPGANPAVPYPSCTAI